MGDVSPDEIPDWMHKLSPELEARLQRFLSAAKEIGVRVVTPTWQLKWKGPAGDLTLAFLQRGGQIWTNTLGASYTKSAAILPSADRYKKDLKDRWNGLVMSCEDDWVTDENEKPFLIQGLTDQHFDEWIEAIEAFQRDVCDQQGTT